MRQEVVLQGALGFPPGNVALGGHKQVPSAWRTESLDPVLIPFGVPS